MLQLVIPNIGEFRLIFSEFQKFAMCKLKYIDEENSLDMCEDYLYVFVEKMLGRLNNIPTVEKNTFGIMGKWQEYFYFNSYENRKNSTEIMLMKNSLFISTENYGVFLYKYKGSAWLEINKGYKDEYNLSPKKFYSDPQNYRISLVIVPDKVLVDWKTLLSDLYEKHCI